MDIELHDWNIIIDYKHKGKSDWKERFTLGEYFNYHEFKSAGHFLS